MMRFYKPLSLAAYLTTNLELFKPLIINNKMKKILLLLALSITLFNCSKETFDQEVQQDYAIEYSEPQVAAMSVQTPPPPGLNFYSVPDYFYGSFSYVPLSGGSITLSITEETYSDPGGSWNYPDITLDLTNYSDFGQEYYFTGMYAVPGDYGIVSWEMNYEANDLGALIIDMEDGSRYIFHYLGGSGTLRSPYKIHVNATNADGDNVSQTLSSTTLILS